MNTQPVTRTQLELTVKKELDRTADEEPAPLILVRGALESAFDELTIDNRSIQLLASSSPLDIRAHASKPRSNPLVVVTNCDNATLGDDLVARSRRRKVHSIDRWVTVASLFGSEGVSRSLSEYNEIADALIELKPPTGYRPVINKVLDYDTAVAALSQVLLGHQPDSLVEVLTWAESAEATATIANIDSRLVSHVESHLVHQFGSGVAVTFAVLNAQLGYDVMAVALAAGIIHHEEAKAPDVEGRLEMELGEPDLRSEHYVAIAEAATTRVRQVRQGNQEDSKRCGSWLRAADKLVHKFRASKLAWLSDVVPSGFDQRLAKAAEDIHQLQADTSNPTYQNAVDRSLALAEKHFQTMEPEHRLERVKMAARIVRCLSTPNQVPATLDETVANYIEDGAWLDRARTLVSQGDTNPTVQALCEAVTSEADRYVLVNAEQRARRLAAASHRLDGQTLGVEDVLGNVVAPLASNVPTLMLVMDGMGWPTFLDVLDSFELQGWQTIEPTNSTRTIAAMAALPTITEYSRTSLLCGKIRSGNKESERRAFEESKALTNVSLKNKPPQLFHKTELRVGGIDTLPDKVLDTIKDDTNKIVGLVLNNIDERLKDVAPPEGGWDLSTLSPLREVLEAARLAGRSIVVTADHGHVLERDTECRPGGGGERWRRPETGPAAAGEIEINGNRVVADGNTVIVPWVEKLRYAKGRRNGYHGGITPAEAIVPVVVLASEVPEGWTEAAISPPSWWYPAVNKAEPTESQTKRSSEKRKQAASAQAPTLFEGVGKEAVDTSGTSIDPISRIMSSSLIINQLTGLRLDASQVEKILRLLDSVDTKIGEGRIADQIGEPRMRMRRMVSQMQRLLNIDGYPILETTNSEVSFDRSLLETQLGIG